jgi:hypothetical protein
MTEYIYYAKGIGDPNWKEEVVLETKRPLTETEQGTLEALLIAQGKVFVRVWEFKGEAPDFAGTVRI